MADLNILALDFNNPVFCWLVGLLSCHLLTQAIFTSVGPFKANPALFAHQISAFVGICFIGINGTYYWFTEAADVQDRLYTKLTGAVIVTRVSLAFQTYDLITTLCISKLRSIEMIFHHSMAIILAYSLLTEEYSHYYAIFYLGMTEISAIPLCIVDIFKNFREMAKKFEIFNMFVRVTFAALFLLVRGVYWPIISVRFFSDALLSLQDGRCQNRVLTMFFMIANILLSLLQWYWSFLIIKALVKMFSKNQPKSKEK